MRIVIYIVIGVLCCVSATASSNHDNINKSPYSAKKRAKGRANNSNNYASKLSGEYVPETGPWSVEPTCEQLREMWRQSKRHSRAAEASNEIPQYVDPFARAYSRQMAVNPLATLRPRPERRPVIYGRLRESAVEEKPRPFDVLRRLNGQRITPSSVVDPSSAAVLLSEQDLSPFPKPSAKGSLQHLRELYREEQGPISGSKGAMDRLREQIREENRQTVAAPAWSTGDIGRVVTSPADHKYSLYGMQGDAPYSDANRARYNNNRLRQTDMTKIRNEQSFFDNGRISLTSQGGRSGGGGGGGGGGATTWKSRRHAPSPQDDDAIYERMDTQDEDEDTRYQAILQARRVSDPSTVIELLINFLFTLRQP